MMLLLFNLRDFSSIKGGAWIGWYTKDEGTAFEMGGSKIVCNVMAKN